VGDYSETISISGSNGASVQLSVSFSVSATPVFAVTVINGSGSSSYEAGVTVTVTANPASAGKVFDKWTSSDGVVFNDATSSTTTFVMLSKAVTVTATYKDVEVSVIRDKSKNEHSGIRLSNNIVSDKAVITVDLPNNERVSQVKAVVYDNVGNVVFERTERGNSVTWNLTNNAGRNVANGSYLVVVEAKNTNGKSYPYTAKVGVRR
jgi:flagellar hook assembly protein FlgD